MDLLDTMVISELSKRNRNVAVTRWGSQQEPDSLYISAISTGEIRRGICLQENKNPKFAIQLQEWLEGLILLYGHHILPIFLEIALSWGEVSANTGYSGADNLILATALHYKLIIIPRNTKHLGNRGVKIINPWVILLER